MANNLILFFRSKRGDECNCFKEYMLLNRSKWIFLFRKFLLIRDNRPEFSEFSSIPKPVIIFGYKDLEYPLVETENNNISHRWFKNKIPLGIFFMPKGNELFSYKDWQDQFENYVTFKDKYEFLTDDLLIVRKTSPKMYKKIFSTISTKTKTSDIKTRIKEVYESTVMDLCREIEKGSNNQDDILMTIHKIRTNIYNLV